MHERDKITHFTVNLGLFSNFFLSIVKILVGILGHSNALLADGINSSSDVVYYVVVKIFTKHANKPADEEHPYGHRQLETIAAIVVGAFIITTGIAIFWEAINKMFDFFTGQETGKTVSIYALIIAVITFGLKIFLYIKTNQNYKRTHNPTLKALSNDHFNDIMASIAVIIGVVFCRFNVQWMDPLAGAIVALFILRTGISIIIDSSADLMDTFPDENFRESVRNIVMNVDGVLHLDDLTIHRFGPYFILNLTIAIDGCITIQCGHHIANEIEKRLLDEFAGSLRKVQVHYHPFEELDTKSIKLT